MRYMLTKKQAERIERPELAYKIVELVMFTQEEISQQPSRKGLAKEVLYKGIKMAGEFSPQE